MKWEQESIAKIKKTAEDARNSLLQNVSGNLAEIKAKLDNLTTEIRQGRENHGFVETDLSEWEDKHQTSSTRIS